MSEPSTGTGFRFQKVMAWGAPIILAFALLAMVADQMFLGLALAVMAILFWVIVRRRRGRPQG